MGKIKEYFYKDLVYPLYGSRYGVNYGLKVIERYRFLTRMQWQSSSEIETYQNYKLQRLLKHAYAHVPYYQDIMRKAGMQPQSIKDANDLKHLPILTKELIRRNYDRLISTAIHKKKLLKRSTGGSTGEPLQFCINLNRLIWAEGVLLRSMEWANYKIGKRCVYLKASGTPTAMGRARARLINSYCFPAFAKEDELIDIMQEIKALQPFCLISYASNLYRVASICRKLKLNDIRIPVIFATGEMLYDYQREFLHETFDCEVFDYYGCNETGPIAHECQYHNKHISDERVILETTDSDGNPIDHSLGEITITDLDNYIMPLIRYKNEDTGIISPDQCKCGRYLKLLKSLQGRKQDFLRAIDGNAVPAIFFPAKFRDLKGLDQYQIVQSSLHKVTLKIVKNHKFSIDELIWMIGVIKSMLGEIDLQVEEHSHIPLTARGKNRLVISQVPSRL